MVQHRDDVIPRMRLRIARAVLRYVGGRKAARVVGDAAEVAREEAQLRLPAAVIAGELVHEHERRAAAALLVIQADGAPPHCETDEAHSRQTRLMAWWTL